MKRRQQMAVVAVLLLGLSGAAGVAVFRWLSFGWVDFQPLCIDHGFPRDRPMRVAGRLKPSFAALVPDSAVARRHPSTGVLRERPWLTLFNPEGSWNVTTKTHEAWARLGHGPPCHVSCCEVIRDHGMEAGARLRPGWVPCPASLLPHAARWPLYQCFADGARRPVPETRS